MIFSDGDVFVEEWDICGNLRMCQRYDCTTGFKNIIELTRTDTQKLHGDRAMLMRWFNADKSSRNVKRDVFDKYCISNRRSLLAAGGWEEQGPEGADLQLSSKTSRQPRVFESPNDAPRLHHD